MIERILAHFGYVKQKPEVVMTPAYQDPLIAEFKELERQEEAKKPIPEQVQNLLMEKLSECSVPQLFQILETAKGERRRPVAKKPCA